MKFGTVLCNASTDDSFERKVWNLMQPYLLEIAQDRHPNGCHILFENFSMTSIKTLGEIIEKEDIEFYYAESTGTGLYLRHIIWNVNDFCQGICHCYRNISDKMLKIKKDTSGEVLISIEKIDENELKKLREFNTYIS